MTSPRNAGTTGARRRAGARRALLYSLPMTSPSDPRPARQRGAWPAAYILLFNLLVWGLLCAAGAAGVYSDLQRDGSGRAYAAVLQNWVWNHLLLAALSSALYLTLRRWPSLLASAGRIGAAYLLLLLLFLPLQLYYLAALGVWRAGGVPDWPHGWVALWQTPGFNVFLEFAWTSGTYVAVCALSVWRAAQQRERAWRDVQTDNLRLHLELERQRMLALRAQLEPHFIFNALNAISALVRTRDEDLALTGIQRLSELLRYAMTASSRDWVSAAEELAFVRDYLDLQRLRYGSRLQVQIDADPAQLAAADCPPLLLQPLVENALRHELDCHDGAGDLRLALHCTDAALQISVSNPAVAGAPANPGLGLGLANTRARLQLAYRGAATLVSAERDGRFDVTIRMPLHGAEPT
ncbi:MAG: sensor histidine kinase [Sphingomonadaceae bacterium]